MVLIFPLFLMLLETFLVNNFICYIIFFVFLFFFNMRFYAMEKENNTSNSVKFYLWGGCPKDDELANPLKRIKYILRKQEENSLEIALKAFQISDEKIADC